MLQPRHARVDVGAEIRQPLVTVRLREARERHLANSLPPSRRLRDRNSDRQKTMREPEAETRCGASPELVRHPDRGVDSRVNCVGEERNRGAPRDENERLSATGSSTCAPRAWSTFRVV